MASGSSNAFMQNFMMGFSFVDNINSRKRKERLLEQRLKDDQEERLFQRGRQLKSDAQRDTLLARNEEDRQDRIADEEKEEEGNGFAADPNSSDDDLIRTAPWSAAARAELERRRGKAAVRDAIAAAGTIPTAGQATQSQGAGSPRGQSLSEAVAEPAARAVDGPGNAPGLPSMTDEERVIHDDAFGLSDPEGFAASQGPSSVRQVTEEDIEAFDPEFQEKGFAGRVAEGITGNVQQVTSGVGNIAEAAVGATHPRGSVRREVISPGPRAAGAAFAGDAFITDEFVSKTEFDLITDPEEREAVRTRNEELITEQKARARNPNRFALSRPITRQGAVREGGELARDDALRYQNQQVSKYEEFLEGTGGSLETAAINEPQVAAADYLQNRATLAEARPDMIAGVDARMVPIFEAAQAEMAVEAAAASVGSPEARQIAGRQRNLNASLNIIAGQQPPVAQQAGINSAGLKIGDTQRVGDVIDTIYNPDRPAPSAVQPGQLNAAIAVAGRISPNKRLNPNQIDALATLAEAGYMDKSTALSVAMTGHWPAGKNPNAIKSVHGRIAVTEAGGYFVLPDPSKTDVPKTTDRSLGTEQIDALLVGASSTGMDESRNNQVTGLALDHAGWIRQHFNTENQESMMAAGRVLGQAVFLSAQEHKRMANDGWYHLTNPKNAPTAEEIFLNPVMRSELAAEYNSRPVPMPAVGQRGDLDLEPFKAGLREGVHGPRLAADVDRMSEDQILYVYWVLNASPEDIAAANAQGQ